MGAKVGIGGAGFFEAVSWASPALAPASLNALGGGRGEVTRQEAHGAGQSMCGGEQCSPQSSQQPGGHPISVP